VSDAPVDDMAGNRVEGATARAVLEYIAREVASDPDGVELIGLTVISIPGLLLRDDCKTDPSVKAIDREIVAVHCEDPPDAFSLSHSDKCRVREIHRAVGILDHELSHAGYVYQVEGEESHRSSRQHLPNSFLGFWKIP